MKNKSTVYYALILLGLTLITQMFSSYNYSYYVDEIALISLQQASIAKIIFLLFDAGNDVLFGYLSEKFSFKLGKRKTWLIFGLPLFCVAFFFTFAIDAETTLSNSQVLLYYIFITITFDNFSSLLYVNHSALFPVLFSNDEERTKASSLNRFLEIIGTSIIFISAPILKEKLGYMTTCVIYIIIFLIIMTIALMNLKEPIDKTPKQKQEKFNFKQALKDVRKNKSFLWYMISSASFLTILGTLITILPFLVKYTMKITGTQQTIVTAIGFLCVAISFKGWSHLIKKKGHRYAYKMSFILLPIITFLLGSSFNFWSTLIAFTFSMPFVGGMLMTPDLMMADIIDEDFQKHHIRREAALMSMASFVRRFSLLIAAALIMLISSFCGYQDGSNPGTNPELSFRLITMVFLPCVACIGTIASQIYLKLSASQN